MATAKATDENNTEQTGSDDVYDNVCQPCSNDGNTLEAEGRCEDCHEYLCKRCFEVHTVPSVTRHHVLIGKHQMNKDGVTHKKDQSTQKCAQHGNKNIKYYRPTHSFLGCSACMILSHKSCDGAVYIPDVAKDVLTSEEFSNYKQRKTNIETKSHDIADDSEQKMNRVKHYKLAAVENIRCFKREIIDACDKAEKEVIDECELIEEDEKRNQENIYAISKEVEKEMKVVTSNVEKFESKKQYCNMYIELIKVKNGLNACDNSLRDIDHRSDYPRAIYFSPDHTLVDDILKHGIGDIGKGIEQVVHDTDINVKTQSDIKDCWISGSAILPGNKLVIADASNLKLKLIDTVENKMVDDLPMSDYPWAVTMTCPTEIATTMPTSKKIAFVKVDSKLVKVREIVVDEKCKAVTYSDNKLIVIFSESPKIVIMDMQGVVLRTIASNDTNALLDRPWHVLYNSMNKAIYVSNVDGKNVLYLKSDGTVISTYTNTDLKGPLDMTLDGLGMVYICDWLRHTIHQVTEDFEKDEVLLGPNDVTKPYTISFCHVRDMFYVGMRDCDILKAFKVD